MSALFDRMTEHQAQGTELLTTVGLTHQGSTANLIHREIHQSQERELLTSALSLLLATIKSWGEVILTLIDMVLAQSLRCIFSSMV